ncbi:MAG TPA: hypothetical protein VHG08_02170, partial [Longimicrobium sp.]|nr:hypothetical protein [Longimicrobium sp.]
MNNMLVLKANVAGTGYVYHGLDASVIAPRDVDEALPRPGYPGPAHSASTAPEGISYPPRSCVAYAISRLGSGQCVYAVGGYWPHYRDEFEREGIFVWLALITGECSPEQAILHGGRLAGVVKHFEERYESIGTLLGRLAADSAAQQDVVRVLLDAWGRGDGSGATKIEPAQVSACVVDVPEVANLHVPLPLSPLFAIPCLAYLLATRQDAGRVGGGSLSRVNARSMPLVALRDDVPGYPVFTIDPRPLLAGAGPEPSTRDAGGGPAVVEPADRREDWIGRRTKIMTRISDRLRAAGPVRQGFLHALQLVLLFSIFLMLYSQPTPPAAEQAGAQALMQGSSSPGTPDAGTSPTTEAGGPGGFSPALFQSDVVDPLVAEVLQLRPDGLGSDAEVRTSLLWQLKAQGG